MKRATLQRKTPLRSRPRPPAEKPPRALPAPIPLEHRRSAVMLTPALLQPVAPIAKPETHRSSGWLAAVRAMETCVLCGAHGVEPAHRNEGKGKGIKVHDCWTAALCRTCHDAIDQGKDLTREQRRAEIDRAIVLTLAELVKAGKVGVLR